MHLTPCCQPFATSHADPPLHLGPPRSCCRLKLRSASQAEQSQVEQVDFSVSPLQFPLAGLAVTPSNPFLLNKYSESSLGAWPFHSDPFPRIPSIHRFKVASHPAWWRVAWASCFFKAVKPSSMETKPHVVQQNFQEHQNQLSNNPCCQRSIVDHDIKTLMNHEQPSFHLYLRRLRQRMPSLERSTARFPTEIETLQCICTPSVVGAALIPHSRSIFLWYVCLILLSRT